MRFYIRIVLPIKIIFTGPEGRIKSKCDPTENWLWTTMLKANDKLAIQCNGISKQPQINKTTRKSMMILCSYGLLSVQLLEYVNDSFEVMLDSVEVMLDIFILFHKLS